MEPIAQGILSLRNAAVLLALEVLGEPLCSYLSYLAV